ncbi:MAG TPA: S41 family peptidase [Labilithrix sp.]|nr:S41 family peptidase [Labilithrix sp.]
MMITRTRIGSALFALLAVVSCGQAATQDGSTGKPSATLAPGSAPASAAAPAPPAEDEDEAVPADKFGEGARAFATVKDTLLKNYYAEGITEDDLYRAATAGMLEKLDPKMKKWNRLLTATEMAELRNDLKGEVVGIGVQISFDSASGYADVQAALPGSPSEKAGLVAGDKIVTVNGKLYKGMQIKDVVMDIRGKAGEPVTLSVLRADKLLSFTVTRERVAFDQTSHALLADGLGYLHIPSFTEKTPAQVKEALDDLAKQGAKALVLDLRGCPGGSFDSAIATGELLLPDGAGIVTLKKKGKEEEKHVAGKGKGILTNLPLAVLVSGATSSGAEFLTGALQEGRHARVVGQHTHGKWSVQSLDDLPNGYAFKYTVSLFKTPSGRSFDGTGLVPDVEVAMEAKDLARANGAKPAERLALDVQLRTAKELLLRR